MSVESELRSGPGFCRWSFGFGRVGETRDGGEEEWCSSRAVERSWWNGRGRRTQPAIVKRVLPLRRRCPESDADSGWGRWRGSRAPSELASHLVMHPHQCRRHRDVRARSTPRRRRLPAKRRRREGRRRGGCWWSRSSGLFLGRPVVALVRRLALGWRGLTRAVRRSGAVVARTRRQRGQWMGRWRGTRVPLELASVLVPHARGAPGRSPSLRSSSTPSAAEEERWLCVESELGSAPRFFPQRLSSSGARCVRRQRADGEEEEGASSRAVLRAIVVRLSVRRESAREVPVGWPARTGGAGARAAKRPTVSSPSASRLPGRAARGRRWRTTFAERLRARVG